MPCGGIFYTTDFIKIKQKLAYTWIAAVSLIKFLLVNQLPLQYAVNALHDDALMVNLANYIYSGELLGKYDSNTLVKGLSGPLFLAFNRFIGISYEDALCLLYIFTCLIIIIAFRSKLNAAMQAVVYTVLLFNPASMNSYSFQRIYRCSLTPAQVLLLFGFFWSVFFNKKQREKYTYFPVGDGIGPVFVFLLEYARRRYLDDTVYSNTMLDFNCHYIFCV